MDGATDRADAAPGFLNHAARSRIDAAPHP